MQSKYGLLWPDDHSDLSIELVCFRECKSGKTGYDQPYHFKNIVSIIAGPKSKRQFKWHPWADDMLEEACEQMYLAFSGCASSGKSSFVALWALIKWLSSPHNTAVIITSTSLKKAKQTIWGDVQQFFLGAPGLPGKLLSSPPMIRTWDGKNQFDDKVGIHLIAGNRSKEKENIANLVGIKSHNLILIAEELPELSPALFEAATTNLASNPNPQMIGTGNFKSIYDSFGQFIEPKQGWGSIGLDSERWEMKNGGLCLRFDGLKSPNIISGVDKFPFIYNSETLARHLVSPGDNTAGFYRMCRSFLCPEHDANCIYSEADFLRGKVHELATWMDSTINVAFLDPAFATGGDRAMAEFGKLGLCTDGIRRLQFTKSVEIREDLRLTTEARPLQVARQYIALCKQENVEDKNAGYDASGGGLPFGSLLSELWSPRLFGLQFGGSASDMLVSGKDNRKGKDAYVNRVTEIWFQGLEYIQSDQIRGMTFSAAKELKARKYDTQKSGTFLRNKVEPKEEMKLRTGGISPDESDGKLGVLMLCRERLGFTCGGIAGRRAKKVDSWAAKARQADSIYEDAYSSSALEELEAA